MRRTGWATDTAPLSRKRDALRVPFLYQQHFRGKYIFPYFSFFALKNPKTSSKSQTLCEARRRLPRTDGSKHFLFSKRSENFQSPSHRSPVSANRALLYSGITHRKHVYSGVLSLYFIKQFLRRYFSRFWINIPFTPIIFVRDLCIEKARR